VAQSAAFIETDGDIVSAPAGSGAVEFGTGPGNYYVVVEHRNHLAIMSDTTVDFGSGSGTHDFRTQLNGAYTGGGAAMKEVETDVYGMFACDINADGSVQALDFNDYIADTVTGATGYLSADCNMDANVQALDFNVYLSNTLLGASSQVP
jgi:hypothetical protein